MKTFGNIPEPPRPQDYILGEEQRLGGSIWTKLIREQMIGGNRVLSWQPWEPEPEIQRKSFETNACVSFSGNNGFEYLVNFEIARDPAFKTALQDLGLLKNGKANFSDRRTAKGSGTDPYQGNTVRAVDDYLRNYFFCPEDLWPFTDSMQLEEYFSIMSQPVADFGKKVKPFCEIETKYIPVEGDPISQVSSIDEMWEGLQYSPLWVSVDGGNYEQAFNYSHRVIIRGGVYGKSWQIHDSYQNQIVDLPWNYRFGAAKCFQFIKKKAPDFLRVGSSIFYLARAGKFAGEYVGCGDGDTMLSIWGDYRKAQRVETSVMPENYFGNSLFIKKNI